MMLITTLVVSFLVCCRLEVRCSKAGVVSGMQVATRTLLCLSSGARDYDFDCHIGRFVLGFLQVGG